MRRLTIATTVVSSLLLLSAATPVFAETLSPWWHLSISSRPTYLQPGRAADERQRLTVPAAAGEYTLEDEGAGLHRSSEVGDEGLGQRVTLVAGEAPGEVQKALEGMYGSGTVAVTSVLPYEVYEVKWVGALASLPVDKMAPREGASERGVEVEELAVGRPDGEIVVTAVNRGDAATNPGVQPLTISDLLPPGLRAVAIEADADENIGEGAPLQCSLGSSSSCTFTGTVWPFEQVQMRIGVDMEKGAAMGEASVASVTGGGAPAATARLPLTVSATPVPFAMDAYEMSPEETGGGADTQAGSHPFQLTTTLRFDEVFEARPLAIYPVDTEIQPLLPNPAGLVKDLYFRLPAGLIGNPTAIPSCPTATFLNSVAAGGETCSQQTILGVARVTVSVPAQFKGAVRTIAEPLYNVEPAVGEPARFGFGIEGNPTVLDTSVRTGGDYGVTVSVTNITQVASVLGSEVTFWGVPGDSRHDKQRCPHAFRGRGGAAPCPALGERQPPPFLSLPTSCNGQPLSSVEGDSWLQATEQQAVHLPLEASPLAQTNLPVLDGCNALPFEPEIKISPDVQEASRPSGLSVDVHVPQEGQLNAEGLAQSNVKDITVTLPAGVTLNPAAADGLQACSETQIGYLPGESHPPSELDFTPKLPEPLQQGVNFCPDAAKVATVKIKSPLLPAGQFVEGAVYLASPQNFQVFPQENPFETHVAMYIVAKDPISGTLVKLPGMVELGGAPGVEGLAPGQIRSTFEDTPQLAFEDAELHFFGGERAPLATPALCRRPGEEGYKTLATFTPWSGGAPVTSTSEFFVTSGPGGGACPNPPGVQSPGTLPFSPSLASGTTNNNAGAFSALTTTLGREDGQQSIQSVTLHYPPGVSGLLSGVELCPEPQANAGTCGPNSQIGETIVSVGLGGDPFTVTGGKAYITGPYNGTGSCTVGTPGCAPFGLSIVNPAKAGPFNLQEGRPVVVRAKVEVDPHTAALTITTDSSGPHAIPTIIEGFPLQIKHVNVLVNRPGFTFNPTSCDPMKVTGTINSSEGASAPVSVPFQVTNCKSLAFAPKFAVSTSGKTSKANGASLHVSLTYPGPFTNYANIAKAKVELPKALPSRLTTLQKACTSAQFEANPAGCPSASFIGHAKAITPLLPVPLEGPAIFVSHGGEAFPSLVMVLQGYGVTIDLVGTTFISKSGITSTTFKQVPDQPVTSFELTLPEGKFSALAANGNLCTEQSSLKMPTEFIAQNGAKTHQNTQLTVTGCKPAITVTHHGVKGKTATIAVSVPAAGKLVATSKGLSKGTGKIAKAGTVTVKLTLTKGEAAFLGKHKGRKLQSKINLTFTPAKTGSKLKTSTTVRVG